MRLFQSSTLRPYLLALGVVVSFSIADYGNGRFLNVATAFSVLQLFATLGPLALGLGLTMVAREFDLSIVGMMSLSGCIAVLTGVTYPAAGIAFAILVGAFVGAVQGLLIVKLGISSIGITLGGLLTCSGMAYVLTDNTTIGYSRMDVASFVNSAIGGIFSLRSLLTIAAFVIVAAVFTWTRIGRDIVATGSNRNAAVTAGVNVSGVLIGLFALSGALTALSGGLLSYSLAAASPVALTDALVPATAAAIIGGASLTGGRGDPLGIAGGVLVLCILRSGLTSIGVLPYVQDLITGGVLITVALLDAPGITQAAYQLRRLITSRC